MSHVHYINGYAYDAAQIEEYLERVSAARVAKRKREAAKGRQARAPDLETEAGRERVERPESGAEEDPYPGTRYA